MSNNKKVSHLTRMQMHGWFDILVRAICIGLIFGIVALVGQISYINTAKTYTAEMGAYEREQALNWFARNRGFMLTLCAGFCAFGVAGLLVIRYVSPMIDADVHRQVAMRKAAVIAQNVGATVVAMIMIFPLYWMIISSFKHTDELLAPTPTLWPETWVFDTYPNVLKRAPFGKYFFNTIYTTFFQVVFQLGIGVMAAYGFSKGEFKAKGVLFIVVLGALMVPL